MPPANQSFVLETVYQYRLLIGKCDLGVGLEPASAGRHVEEIRLEHWFDIELAGEAKDRAQDLDEAVILQVADDPEANHPVSASLSCRARTRAAIPVASRPQDASWRARAAA